MRKTDFHTRRHTLALLAATSIAAISGSSQADAPAVLIHKDPDCGCCSEWVKHLRNEGLIVTVEEAYNLETVRARLRVPATLASCHTAEVAGYVIEGHVPAEAIRHLLDSRPNGLGLAVPGMPPGSPGMEGRHPVPYDVILFGVEGQRTFMRFVGRERIAQATSSDVYDSNSVPSLS